MHAMRDLADIFKALADENRLLILALLIKHGELCVCDIEQMIDASQSKASRHLRYLLHAGLVQDRRVSVWVHYRVAGGKDGPQEQILQFLHSMLSPERMAEIEQRIAAWRMMHCVDGKCLPASERAKAEPAAR